MDEEFGNAGIASFMMFAPREVSVHIDDTIVAMRNCLSEFCTVSDYATKYCSSRGMQDNFVPLIAMTWSSDNPESSVALFDTITSELLRLRSCQCFSPEVMRYILQLVCMLRQLTSDCMEKVDCSFDGTCISQPCT